MIHNINKEFARACALTYNEKPEGHSWPPREVTYDFPPGSYAAYLMDKAAMLARGGADGGMLFGGSQLSSAPLEGIGVLQKPLSGALAGMYTRSSGAVKIRQLEPGTSARIAHCSLRTAIVNIFH